MNETIKVLPRDLQPGDKIDRINQDLDFVKATIARVEKVRRQNSTAYKVYLAEQEDLPSHRRSWPEYTHLRPFVLRPTNRVEVER